jgi:NADH-quinone oxidoreductase subunit A
MVIEYYKIFLDILVIFIVALTLFGLSYALVLRSYDVEKISTYECGFDPFEDSRSVFEVRFYLVALLFAMFDLEISFLFPWSVSVSLVDGLGVISLLVFYGILTVGFLYEWMKGALDWE